MAHIRLFPILLFCFFWLFAGEKLTAQVNTDSTFKKGYAQLSVFHPVGTAWKSSKKKEFNFSVNLLYGHIGTLKGFEFGGLVSIAERDIYGFQFSGLNLVKRNVAGFQFGLVNVVQGKGAGIQLSAIWTHNQGNYTGFQFSWFGNTNWGNVYGAQLSHLWNHANKDLNGLQFALGPNTVGNDALGIQMSATFNYARRKHNGAQFAFLANYAEESDGLQFGAVNIAKKSGGFQIGLVNYSGDSSVATIGLINIVKGGYNKLELWGGELLSFNLALKTGGRKVYSIISAGGNPFNENKFWAFGWGFGVHIPFSKRFYADIDQITSLVNINEFISINSKELTLLEQVRFTCGFALHKRVALFVGPVWNILLSNNNTLVDGKNGIELAPTFRTFYGKVGEFQTATWPGICGGIRFF